MIMPAEMETRRPGILLRARDWVTGPFEFAPDAVHVLALSAGLWIFAVFLTSVVAILSGYVHVLGEYLTLVSGTVTAVLIAGVLYLVFRQLAGRPAWLAIVIIPPAVVVAATLQMWADYSAQFLMNSIFTGMTMPDSSTMARVKITLVYVCIYATNAAIFWVAAASRRIGQHQRLAAEREASALRAELRALRLQLNPHFMFNALSALSTLLLTDRRAEASEMTDRLSDFLRAAMDIEASSDITLSDEFSVLDAYLDVEAVRFGPRLEVAIHCDADVEAALVPNLLLQPLVENAMKHAVEPSSEPVQVSIRAAREGDRLRFEVSDTGATVRGARPAPRPGHGVGLTAVRQRLALRYGEAARVDAGPRGAGYATVIDMPLILAV